MIEVFKFSSSIEYQLLVAGQEGQVSAFRGAMKDHCDTYGTVGMQAELIAASSACDNSKLSTFCSSTY